MRRDTIFNADDSGRSSSTSPPQPVIVLYATRDGHTRRIANAITAALRNHGLEADIIELGLQRSPERLERYGAVILASPVNTGRYARAVIAFVKAHRSELERMSTAFVSVSLSQAGVERSAATPEEHARFAADVRRVNERFFAQTGWQPTHVENVAGALLYTRYNFLIRFVMKWIARASGGSTDTSRDHDYTDWVALERFVAVLAVELGADVRRRPHPAY